MAQTILSSGFKLSCLFSSILLITACGGGSGSDSAANPPADAANNPATPAEPSTPVVPADPEEAAPPPAAEKPPADACAANPASCETRAKQTIPALYTRYMVIGNLYDLEFKSSANLAVSIKSLSPTICSVSGIEIQALNNGSCTLEFSQAGNTTYAPVAENKTIPVYTAEQAAQTNINTCQAGVLAQKYKTEALNTLNDIRALHGLKPVAYDYTRDDEVMQAALITAANPKNDLTHYPEKTLPCYTEAGDKASQTSNIGLRWSSSQIVWKNDFSDIQNVVISAMTEKYSSSIGHRRWLLNPFLTKVAVGAVISSSSPFKEGSAMKVIYPSDSIKATTNTTGLIAYPYQNYPAKYFEKNVPLSMSIFYDQKALWNNSNVDYSQATLQVTERSSSALQTITKVAFDNKGSGLPNSIQFNFDTLSYNTTYDVKVSNVKVKGVATNYNYWFKVTE
ncbi:CAP domain-containing protein [Acinetobacter sp. ANC 3813]|uniref:CAP domain-containing protein n=1 Tax=Acinetobacter sp. ANC 3813 TaxID=1977873 RepID=UPI000A336DB3|nr:CAP domain-containing protein [Acinetobacter sp. ANC 3813]OTG89660.1 hypothetical protein B9T34_10630 [Acinetobacter sp. ANC 3813]